MKRKAYIGLSTPTAYFYDHKQEFFNEPWKWNPILESPQGLITLFDELWFLSRSLCPVSLRNQTYVKFLDEDSDYQTLIKELSKNLKENKLAGLATENPLIGEIIDLESQYPKEQFKKYNEVIKYVYGRQPSNEIPIDNHSHGLDLCGFDMFGDSMRIDLLAFDIAFINRLGVQNIELISNSFNSIAFRNKPNTIKNIQVAQNITIKRIPVLQSPNGPIIERIEAIRENNFLIDFRAKILETDNFEDLEELVSDIENEYNSYKNDVLLEKLNGSRLGTSIAKNAVSFAVGLFFPGAVEVKSLISDTKTRNFNWTGFIAEIEK